MSAGPDRQMETDFSRGMFVTGSPDLIPVGGVSDARNVIFDDQGSPRRRGGTDLIAADQIVSAVTMLWQGYVNGPYSLLGGSQGIYTIYADGHLTPIPMGAPGPGTAMIAPTIPTRPVFRTEESRLYFRGPLYIEFGPDGAFGGQTMPGSGQSWSYYAAAAGRLFRAEGTRVSFSGFGEKAAQWDPTDYHEMPRGAQIVGLQALRTSVAVFTTEGIFVIRNVAYDLTDDAGNVQQALDLYSGDIVLWGDAGVASYQGATLVPALDGLWLLSLGESSEAATPVARLSDSISDLWRFYVAAGCVPGVATVHQGHYFLPILDLANNRVVDLLVCRLDLPRRPWSHFDGYGGQVRAVMAPATSAQALLGHGNTHLQRIRWLEPGSATDGNGSAHVMQLLTRRIATGPLNRNTLTRLRLHRESTGPVTAAFEADDLGSESTFEALAPADPEGMKPYSWQLRRRTRYMRFRLKASAPCRIRAIEAWTRSYGKL